MDEANALSDRRHRHRQRKKKTTLKFLWVQPTSLTYAILTLSWYHSLCPRETLTRNASSRTTRAAYLGGEGDKQ